MDSYDRQTAMQWMPRLEPIPNCPPGLEYLTQINQLLVRQSIELLEVHLSSDSHIFKDPSSPHMGLVSIVMDSTDLEVFSCLETSNKYEVMNNQGQRIYFAEEKHHCFLRHFCGSWRPFTVTIYDNVGRDVITLYRSLRGSCCLSDCCRQKLKVEAPPGEKIGYVYQNFHPCFPIFKLKNENKKDVMKIKGPCIISNCLMDVNFKLLSLDDEKVIGKMTKKLTGYMTDMLTDVNKFGIQFPVDLDVKMKALMLAASFLIDYTYFEICS